MKERRKEEKKEEKKRRLNLDMSIHLLTLCTPLAYYLHMNARNQKFTVQLICVTHHTPHHTRPVISNQIESN
jgi:hypothetical protein